MTYSELQINLDLLDQKDKLNFIKENLPCYRSSSKLFAVCDDGDCHLFDEDGNECDINEVKEIEEFKYNYDKLIHIKIPKNVTSIGVCAFYVCRGLTNVVIPDSVKSIWDSAFCSCSGLTNMKIPDSVTSVNAYAAAYCSRLTSVIIPKGVVSIGDFAFRRCSKLTSVTIGNSIIHIGFDTFYNCDNLKELIFKDKTINEIKSMKYYPWGIKDKSIIRCV